MRPRPLNPIEPLENPPPDLPDDPTLSYKPPSSDESSTGVSFSPGNDPARTMPSDEPPPGEATSDSYTRFVSASAQSAHDRGYNLLRLIGEGGAGEVWEAEQRALRRIVAVKKIKADKVLATRSTPTARRYLVEQFQAEALTAAHLDHPNILPVHDLCFDEEGHPLLAMKRVHGIPWSSLIDRDSRSMAYDTYLARHIPILLDVAQAVAFAHSKGIIHRDIKPSQVMVGDYGEVLLMDWGLAIVVGREDRRVVEKGEVPLHGPTPLTASSPAGTPVYMAPEQTERSARNVGPWTDVYLLGGTLYYLLTGHPPHKPADKEETFRQAAEGIVTPLEQSAPAKRIPAELADLALEALRPRIEDRVQTAKEFVARVEDWMTGSTKRMESLRITREVATRLDRSSKEYTEYGEALGLLSKARTLWPGNPDIGVLHEQTLIEYIQSAIDNGDLMMARVQAGQLDEGDVRSRIVSTITELEDRQRHREAQRRIALGAVALLLVISFVAAMMAIRLANEATRANEETRVALEEVSRQSEEARQARLEAEREQYFAAIGYANSTLRDHNVRRIRSLLDSTPVEWRGWEWDFLDRSYSRQKEVFTCEVQLLTGSFSPDSSEIAFGGEGPTLYLWDRSTGETTRLEGHTDKIYDVVYSPDGRYVLTASKDQTAIVWDRESRSIHNVLAGHSDFVLSARFNPRGDRVVTASADATARLWDLETGDFVTMTGHEGIVNFADFSPDGKVVATVGSDRITRLWDAETAGLIRAAGTPLESSTVSVSYSPNGKRLLCTTWSGLSYLLNAETLEREATLELHTDLVFRGAWSDDGRYAALASRDGTVSIWDGDKGEFLFRVVGHEAGVWGVRFAPQSHQLLTASYDNTGRVWDVDALNPRILRRMPLFDEEDAAEALQVPLFATDDRSLSVIDQEWSPPGGRTLVTVGERDYVIVNGYTVYSPDWKYLLHVDGPGTVVVADTDEEAAVLFENTVLAAVFSPDGSLLAASDAQKVYLYSTHDWQLLGTIPNSPFVRQIAFSADSSTLAMNSLNSITRVWDVRSMEQVSVLDDGAPMGVYAIALSPDGSTVATALSPSYTIRIWNSKTGELLHTCLGHTYRVWALDYSPDGKRLASASWDGTVRLWEAASGREVLLLDRRFEGLPISVRYSPNGRRLVAPTSNGELEVWDAGD